MQLGALSTQGDFIYVLWLYHRISSNSMVSCMNSKIYSRKFQIVAPIVGITPNRPQGRRRGPVITLNLNATLEHAGHQTGRPQEHGMQCMR
jgi:hypothetical protein